jgi:hypothetical protein
MKNVDSRYWYELALITLFLIGLGWIAFVYLFPGQYPPVLPLMLAVMVVVTVAGQVVLTRLMDQKFSKFNSAFLIYKGLKILILMALCTANTPCISSGQLLSYTWYLCSLNHDP